MSGPLSSDPPLEHVRARVLASLDEFPTSIGRYAIRGELGRGGMGIVYDAFDPVLGRSVALKVVHTRQGALTQPLVEQFEREMRATAEIFHPNVVAILDAGVERESGGARPYYVMEQVAGESLEERLTRVGRVELEDGLAIAAAIAAGLAAAHARGLVHRDLKPANVLLAASGTPKIADFGLCSLRDSRYPEGTLVGSAHYIAPEQIQGAPPRARSDLFALGGILVRMFSGVEPFCAADLAAHLQRIQHGVADGLGRLDPAVRTLAEQLLHKDPAQRPASADQVRDRIEGIQKRSLEMRSRARLRWIAGAGGALAIAATLGMAVDARNELIALDAAAAAQQQELSNQSAASLALPRDVSDGSTDVHARNRIYERAGARNRVRVAAMRYNEAVSALNERLAQLPWRWLAFGVEFRPFHTLSSHPAPAGSGPAGGRLRDDAGVLEPAEIEVLEQQIALLWRTTGIDLRIVTERSGAGDLEERAGAYFDAERVGEANGRGLLLYYDLAQRGLRIELGYELERYFPDAVLGHLLREHARYLFDADDPAFALLLGMRMLESRMVRAHFAGEFDPAAATGRAGRSVRGGAGASERVVLAAHELRAFAPPRGSPEGPRSTPRAAYQRYLEWLASGSYAPDDALFSEPSRELLRRWPMTPAYLDWALFLELGQSFEIAVRGERALLYSTSDPYLSPRFLVRGPDGWQLDVIAELEEVTRLGGERFFWTLAHPDSVRLLGFEDLLLRIDDVTRIARGDNRSFPVAALLARAEPR